MNKRKYHAAVAGCLALLSAERMASAVCTDTPASTSAEDELVSAMNPCGPTRSFNIGAMAHDEDMQLSDEWADRGVANTCDTSTELAKQLNSFMLLALGVSYTNNPSFAGESLHGSDCAGGDYCPLTSGKVGGGWHPGFRDQAADTLDTPTEVAVYERRHGFDLPDLARFTCLVYNSPTMFGPSPIEIANPIGRAEQMAHEAWHGWEYQYGHDLSTSCGHERCTGDSTKPFCKDGPECDTWYPHEITTEGNMKTQMHRPYQVMGELACDIVNTPQDWVPLAIREYAKQDASWWAVHNILNGPMPACNSSLNAGITSGVCATPSNQCDQEKPCGGGELCDANSGCCVAPPACTISGRLTCDGNCACDFATGCCPAAATIN